LIKTIQLKGAGVRGTALFFSADFADIRCLLNSAPAGMLRISYETSNSLRAVEWIRFLLRLFRQDQQDYQEFLSPAARDRSAEGRIILIILLILSH